MRKQYIGDNLDMVKRVHLRDSRVPFKNLIVEPMVTDEEPWKATDFADYAACLGVDPFQVRCDGNSRWADVRPARRTDWLRELGGHCGDIFLDPDNGIDPPKGGDLRHVPAAAIQALMAGNACEGRVVMVYQHTPQRTGAGIDKLTSIVAKRVGAVHNSARKIHSFAVLGQHATMIYFCGNQERIAEVQRAFGWLVPTNRLRTF